MYNSEWLHEETTPPCVCEACTRSDCLRKNAFRFIVTSVSGKCDIFTHTFKGQYNVIKYNMINKTQHVKVIQK